jgi:hypothetical protein
VEIGESGAHPLCKCDLPCSRKSGCAGYWERRSGDGHQLFLISIALTILTNSKGFHRMRHRRCHFAGGTAAVPMEK